MSNTRADNIIALNACHFVPPIEGNGDASRFLTITLKFTHRQVAKDNLECQDYLVKNIPYFGHVQCDQIGRFIGRWVTF